MDEVLRLRCSCGRFRGEVIQPRAGTRAICYCTDCQAFAHYLGDPQRVLDSLGGTDILAVHPQHLQIHSGRDVLAAVSLTGRTYRWYARCCRTAIGNTPGDRRLAHIGIVHQCWDLPDEQRNRILGPVRMQVNRHGAHGRAPATPVPRFAAAIVRYLVRLVAARVTGTWRHNPLFDASTGAPCVAPEMLPADAYAALKAAARGRTDVTR